MPRLNFEEVPQNKERGHWKGKRGLGLVKDARERLSGKELVSKLSNKDGMIVDDVSFVLMFGIPDRNYVNRNQMSDDRTYTDTRSLNPK